MYQNAPYNHMNGGPQGPPQQYGGYPTYPNRQYGNTYQQPAATANPDAATAMAGNNNNKPPTAAAATSGLIRLTLRKPMGIVFEPTPDPHNPSQQRGVRICDLPRTGAAFLSGKLQVGDELLSINDKTMSRLTFDEIMDFIIVADKERVDLLFRRPTKEKQAQMAELVQQQAQASMHNVSSSMEPREVVSPTAALGASQSNSVKWVDDNKKETKLFNGGGGPGMNGGGGGRKSRSRRDEDDEDMEEPSRRSRGGGGGGKSSNYSKRRDERDEQSVGDDTYDQYTVESQSQYTMETYEDERKGRRKGEGRGSDTRRGDPDRDRRSKRDVIESGGFLDLLIDTLCTTVIGRDPLNRRGSKKYDDYDDDDRTYDDATYDEGTYDDGTYATYEERDRRRRKDDRSYATEDEGTLATEDDGTRTVETNDESYVDRRKERIKQNFREHQNMKKEERNLNQSNHKVASMEYVAEKYVAETEQSPADEGEPPVIKSSPVQAAPDPPVKNSQNPKDEESAVDTLQVPLRELNFDQDYAADVSVMESLGGPSLLVERARLDYAGNAGAGQGAKFDNLEKQDPELAKLVAVHGAGFECEPGMSKEETAFRDPFAFYEHAVTVLLRENEPEKVRLLSKLMAKYKGRERHLIHKLSARYKKDEKEGGAGGEAVETKTSGMDKIQEGEEDTSGMNDPSRANVDAIETAKNKMESGGDGWGDGWPPAMSDPWGTGNTDGAAADAKKPLSEERAAGAAAAPAGGDDEDSYSDGSSYTGDSGMDGTSPAVIAQVSELLNYVYGKTSVAGQIDRVSTIMRAYEGREAVLLELLETKALIKANADTNGDVSEIPQSVRENPGLVTNTGSGASPTAAVESPVSQQAPMPVVTTPTAPAPSNSKPTSPPAVKSPKNLNSPSEGTTESTKSKKKKKGMFGGMFGSSKKKDKKGKFPTSSKKGQQLKDDGSI